MPHLTVQFTQGTAGISIPHLPVQITGGAVVSVPHLTVQFKRVIVEASIAHLTVQFTQVLWGSLYLTLLFSLHRVLKGSPQHEFWIKLSKSDHQK